MTTTGKTYGMGRALMVGSDMVAGVAVGGLIGWGLDRLTGWWPWCFLVFFVLGTVAGLRMVYRKVMAPDPKEKK
jgi:ATP synthase protein I